MNPLKVAGLVIALLGAGVGLVAMFGAENTAWTVSGFVVSGIGIVALVKG